VTAPPLVVFTDLDGTLLDEETYAFDAAREALLALGERRIPVVLCSSKTRAEMRPLARLLGVDAPLIVENGGAVVAGTPPPDARWRREGDDWLLELGTPRAALLRALAEIAREAGAEVRSFAQLSVHEVSRLTGLTAAAADLARQREYDEPFLVAREQVARVASAAQRRGLRVTRGGRFHHLTGPVDKGRAVKEVRALYAADPPPATLGLGDSANDLSFLSAVDRAVVVPRPGGRIDPDLAASLPGAERAPAPGPAGWNAAVLAVLRGARLPILGGAAT
jgi:mannosyl-3-phosphoglycerate phosphatase